jgi:hypothetical protein
MPHVRGARIVLVVSLASGVASAQAPSSRSPTSTSYEYSAYEREAIDGAVGGRADGVDPAPEGKIIEGIDIDRLEVIEPRDPAPPQLNALHATTRKHVVERELLLHVGDRYQTVLADETARILRTLPQLSLVAVLAVRGSAPDRVRLLVLTKDVWSLRLSWDVQYTNGGMQRLLIQPTETNLLGTHQTVAVRYEYAPSTNTYGAQYVIPRLADSHVQLTTSANVITNRSSGKAEGTSGSVTLGQALWNTREDWAWSSSFAWQNAITRRYVNAQVGVFLPKDAPPLSTGVPYQYRGREYGADASVTRSFGWAEKHDVTFGAQAISRRYDAGDLSAYDPISSAEFVATKVPTDDTRVGPYAEVRTYTTSYLRILDVETLGLQEDFRLGYDFKARAYPVLAPLGSTRTFLGLDFGAQYTVPLGDGYARANVRSITESEVDRLADASMSAQARVVTPRFGFGRVVWSGSVVNRYRNFLNRTSFLGGDGALRGYPTNYLVGGDVASSNLEFRTRAFAVKTVLVGGAVFYDVGGAFDDFSRARIYESIGGGVRVLFPQLDRLVFRVDLGVPIAHGTLPSGVSPVQYFFAFGQAFPVPSIN